MTRELSFNVACGVSMISDCMRSKSPDNADTVAENFFIERRDIRRGVCCEYRRQVWMNGTSGSDSISIVRQNRAIERMMKNHRRQTQSSLVLYQNMYGIPLTSRKIKDKRSSESLSMAFMHREGVLNGLLSARVGSLPVAISDVCDSERECELARA